MTTSKKILAIDLIPQKEPFVFVDYVFDFTDKMFKSTFEVPENHVFVEDGELLKAGFVEVVAQSLAAGMTFFNREESPKIGFIGEVKGFKINGKAKAKDVLDVSVEIQNEVFNVLIISGKISIQENLIAEGVLKLVIQDQ